MKQDTPLLPPTPRESREAFFGAVDMLMESARLAKEPPRSCVNPSAGRTGVTVKPYLSRKQRLKLKQRKP